MKFILAPVLASMYLCTHLILLDSHGADMQLTLFGTPSLNHKITGELHDFPSVRMYFIPAWQDFAIEQDQDVAYVYALEEVCDLLVDEGKLTTGDTEEFCEHVTAVCWVESGLRHYNRSGSVKKGDGGKAVGIGQIHALWETHYGMSRYNRRDNLEMCMRILIDGGWKAGDTRAQNRAFGYYNTGKRSHYKPYVDKVRAAVEKIQECE